MGIDKLDFSGEQFQLEKIGEMLIELKNNFNQVNPELKQQIQRAAQLGWGYPLLDTVGAFVLLDIKDLDDEAFSSFLDEMFKQGLESLQANIMEYAQQLNESNSDLLNQMFFSFENSHYQICIHALFSLIETSMLGFMNGGRKEIKYNSQYIVKRIEQNNLAAPLTLCLVSIHHLLEKYFQSVSFEIDNDPKQNRHWSAHGRYRDYKASKREVVQLMSMLDICLFTSTQINGFEKITT